MDQLHVAQRVKFVSPCKSDLVVGEAACCKAMSAVGNGNWAIAPPQVYPNTVPTPLRKHAKSQEHDGQTDSRAWTRQCLSKGGGGTQIHCFKQQRFWVRKLGNVCDRQDHKHRFKPREPTSRGLCTRTPGPEHMEPDASQLTRKEHVKRCAADRPLRRTNSI